LAKLVQLKDTNSNIFPKLYDSGWQDLEFTSDYWQNRNDKFKMKFRQIGNIVKLSGMIKPKTTIPAGEHYITVLNLPTFSESQLNFSSISYHNGKVVNGWLYNYELCCRTFEEMTTADNIGFAVEIVYITTDTHQ